MLPNGLLILFYFDTKTVFLSLTYNRKSHYVCDNRRLKKSNACKAGLSALLLFIACFSSQGYAEDDKAPLDNTMTNEASADVAPVERHTPNIAKTRHNLLAAHIAEQSPNDEIIWLNDGTEEYLGVLRNETTGDPQGGILVLHSEQRHANWAGKIGDIRKYLTEFGWMTLSIALPDPKKPVHPTRSLPTKGNGSTSEEVGSPENTDDNTEIDDTFSTSEPAINSVATASSEQSPVATELSTQKDLDKTAQQPEITLEKQIILRIRQAMQTLQQRGQLNLVIVAQDYSILPAIKYLSEDAQIIENQNLQANASDLIGRSLITIHNGTQQVNDKDQNQTEPPKQNNLAIAQEMAILNIPTLDMQYTANKLSHQHALTRKNSMRRNNHSNYTLITIDPITSSPRLQKRIRGWLKTNAAGRKIQRK
jgi:hypothetical protein